MPRLGRRARYLGMDADGREVLSFLDGHVAWEASQPPEVGSDESWPRWPGLSAGSTT